MSLHFAVTGCSRGIGAELVTILKEQGHRVTGFDLSPSDAVDSFISLDLNDPTSILTACETATGRFDGLCNNAGLPPRDDNAAALLQVNFLGQRQFTNQLLGKLNKGASIVNMASRAGHHWHDSIDQVKRLAALQSGADVRGFLNAEDIDATRAYNLTKEAMILWSMAETEPMIERGFRVNSISPGAIATDILEDFSRAFGDKVARNVARTGRPGAPREVAQLAAFLLSKQSGWINGSDIPIDGGMGGFNACDQLGLDVLRSS